MFDYKRRTSEVVRADRESRREKNNRKLTTVSLMIDAATAAGPTPEIRLPKISSAMRVPTDDVVKHSKRNRRCVAEGCRMYNKTESRNAFKT